MAACAARLAVVDDEIRLQIHRYPLTRYLQRQWVSVGFRQVGNSIVPIASLDPKAPRWLWDEYLLRGGINLIVGAKGVGKTSLVCWLAARASLGVERFGGTPLRVFIDTQEDDPEVVLRPRIEAAGADLSMIETRRPGEPPWKFPRDVDALT
ncbi:MAG: hypothetical protein E6G20_09675, partial [Actinobacteria bacterium]